MEVLRIGVDGDEFNAAHLRIYHVIDGILAGTANADHTNAGECLYLRFNALTHTGAAILPEQNNMQILTIV